MMHFERFPGVFLVIASLLASDTSRGQDRVFTYTYQSTTLGPGQRELEVWNTVRWGRVEYFRGLDQRVEFEVGLTNRLQTAFYLNIHTISQKEISTTLEFLSPGQPVSIPKATLLSETEFSFSNEWKFKLSDPAADPVGVALYGEYSISSRGIELEPRLILDKSLGGALIAFNAAGEFEFEKVVEDDGTEKTENESAMELDLGISCRILPGLYLGAEAMNVNGFGEGRWAYSALFVGPTVSYTLDNFWVNLTVLPQVTAFKGGTHDGLVLNQLERLHTRLLFSYAF